VTTGVESIAESFARVRADGRAAALMPYLMGCFPTAEQSREIGLACARCGADLVELGVPFSDPLADGPVIHSAATSALVAGATLPAVLEIGRSIAELVPVVVMCYMNVILARGLERFADALVERRMSGLIVPDLPIEEAGDVAEACEARGLALVPLVAPTTPDVRMEAIGRMARGFLYAVSVTGTTGERVGTNEGLARLIERAASHTDVPVAVGFGIGNPEQAAEVAAAGADGVIVGSRLVRAAGESSDPVPAVSELVTRFAAALSPSSATEK